MRNKKTWIATAAVVASALASHPLRAGGVNPDWSIARQWNEETLQAIQLATPRPTVHARNLYHVSAAMYDAWATYDPTARGVYFYEKHTAGDVVAARRETISYAAYRVLKSRFVVGNGSSININTIQANLDALFVALGYDKNFTSTVGNSPAAIGNRLAATIIGATLVDGSNPANNYLPPPGYYFDLNSAMVVFWNGTVMNEPDHWQRLAFDVLVLATGERIPVSLQTLHGLHWKEVAPFAIWSNDRSSNGVYFDLGAPPLTGDEAHAQLAVNLLARSASLDTESKTTIDTSPAVYHNSPLGTYDHQGYGLNPVTGEAYKPNVVLSADYHRALAEYWFDGANTVTPAGHWFVMANQVADSHGFSFSWMGEGEPLDRLHWDIRMYLTLGGALHDAAIAAWSSKYVYDSPRPMSFIRYMAGQGQSSDPREPSYSPLGLPLVEDLTRIVQPEDVAPGGPLEDLPQLIFDNLTGEPTGVDDHVGDVAVRAWTGGLVAGNTNGAPRSAPGHIYRNDSGWHIGDFELGVDDTLGSPNPESTAPKSVQLSELRIGQPDQDTDKYVEIFGPPGASLDGMWFITIGAFAQEEVPDAQGRVVAAVDLSGHAIDADGVFVIARSTCSLAIPDVEALLDVKQAENSTHALVTDFTGYIGQELDYIDNGVLDFTPWSAVLDSVAMKANDFLAGLYLGAPVVGPVAGSTQRQGVEWILAESWMPFQHRNWVGPPYAGHVSAHSAFARSGAEALTSITGTEFFPGGLSTVAMPADSFKIERGPTQDMTLQWASYFDAADEAGASRLWAGVEPTVSDLAGRMVGAATGPRAVIRANALFAGLSHSPDIDGNGVVDVDDLLLLINQWGSAPNPDQTADLDGNGVVDVDDLLLVINNWG